MACKVSTQALNSLGMPNVWPIKRKERPSASVSPPVTSRTHMPSFQGVVNSVDVAPPPRPCKRARHGPSVGHVHSPHARPGRLRSSVKAARVSPRASLFDSANAPPALPRARKLRRRFGSFTGSMSDTTARHARSSDVTHVGMNGAVTSGTQHNFAERKRVRTLRRVRATSNRTCGTPLPCSSSTALVHVAPGAQPFLEPIDLRAHRVLLRPCADRQLVLYDPAVARSQLQQQQEQQPAAPKGELSTLVVEEIGDDGDVVYGNVSPAVDHYRDADGANNGDGALPTVPDTSAGEPVPAFFRRPGSPCIEVVGTTFTNGGDGPVVQELLSDDEDCSL